MNPSGLKAVLHGMMQNDDRHSRDWRPGRIIVFSLLALIGLGLLIQLLLAFVAEPLLKDKITSALAGKSQDLTARIEKVDISLLNRQIRLEHLVLFQTDSLQSVQNQPFLIDSLSVPLAVASGIKIWSFLFGDALKIGSVSIREPFLKGVKTTSSINPTSKKVKETLYQRIHSFVDVLEIDGFSVEGFSAIITNSSASQHPIASLGNFSLRFSDIRIDSTSPQRTRLPSSTFEGSADSLQWTPPSGMYQFRLARLRFSSTDSLLDVQHFVINPLYPRYEFSRKIGHEATRIDLQTDSIAFHSLDLPALVEQQKLLASHITIADSKLEVFFSKALPSGKLHKLVFPHVLFRRLETPVQVDSVIVSNADIRYIEQSKLAPQPGSVSFENTSAVIRNLDNTTNEKAITANASTKVMGTGLMKMDFRFPPNSSGTHYISGYVGPMEMEVLNPVLKYLALAQITSGKIDSINFKMELRPQKSTGILKMDYSNFHIKMIDIGKQGKKSEDVIKTFLTNVIAIKEKDEPPLREANISYERVLHKGIFNYWWKSLLSGLKDCVGL